MDDDGSAALQHVRSEFGNLVRSHGSAVRARVTAGYARYRELAAEHRSAYQANKAAPHPARLTWEQLRTLPERDCTALAYAHLGVLWSVQSIDPLIRDPQLNGDPRNTKERNEHIDYRSIAPVVHLGGMKDPVPLDSSQLPPRTAMALLEAVKTDLAGTLPLDSRAELLNLAAEFREEQFDNQGLRLLLLVKPAGTAEDTVGHGLRWLRIARGADPQGDVRKGHRLDVFIPASPTDTGRPIAHGDARVAGPWLRSEGGPIQARLFFFGALKGVANYLELAARTGRLLEGLPDRVRRRLVVEHVDALSLSGDPVTRWMLAMFPLVWREGHRVGLEVWRGAVSSQGKACALPIEPDRLRRLIQVQRENQQGDLEYWRRLPAPPDDFVAVLTPDVFAASALAIEALDTPADDIRLKGTAAVGPQPPFTMEGAVTKTQSPPVLQVVGLPDPVAEQFREYSAQYAGVGPFPRGLFEFAWLLGGDPIYVDLLIQHASDGSKPDPTVFADNLIFNLQQGKDKLVAMLPPADRALADTRLQRAIDAIAKLLAALRSRPFSQVVDLPNRRLFYGPWVDCFEGARRTSQDVLGLLTIYKDSGRSERDIAASGTSAPAWINRMTPGAGLLWSLLEGKCMQATELAHPQVLNTSVQTIRGQVDEIRKLSGDGKAIDNRPAYGYFRPDKPPDWGALKPKRQRRIGRP